MMSYTAILYRLALAPFLMLYAGTALSADGMEISLITEHGLPDGGREYSVKIQIFLAMLALTLIPSALMMVTSFTRIIIVLGILRHALGTNSAPSNQILIGMALFLTMFVMSPVFNNIYADAVTPYMNGSISAESAMEKGIKPVRAFMLNQTRESDIALFAGLANIDSFDNEDDVPLKVLIPSFIASELKTAFQIGFMIFIPFLVIDIVVASVLMGMGMMMLSPMMISMPFKLMLFVMIDGWALIMGTLAASFNV